MMPTTSKSVFTYDTSLLVFYEIQLYLYIIRVKIKVWGEWVMKIIKIHATVLNCTTVCGVGLTRIRHLYASTNTMDRSTVSESC